MIVGLDSGCIARAARSLEVFAHLPESVGIELLERGQRIDFPPGEFLIRQGETSEFALVLLEGTADVLVETRHGPAHLASLSAPALVGEIGVLTRVSRTASIRAQTRVRTVRIEAAALHRAGFENPRFLSAILTQLGRRLETFNKAVGFYSHALAALRQEDFDLTLLDDLMNPLPELVDFSRSFRDLAEQINLRRAHREQMASAKAIQRSMLPDRGVLAACRHLVDVQADMRSAQDVGGDLYDFVPLDPDRLAITIGDVCGKGIPAALFMAMTQTVMRYTLCYETDLAAALKAGNALLAASNRERMFATFFCGVLDIRSGALCYCTCGHQAPVLLRNGRTTELVSSPNLPLGLRSTVTFKTDKTVLERGDRLLLYTDGYTDATNAQGEQFGDARFRETVARLSAVEPQQLVPELLQAVDEFAAGAPQFDDLTSVLITMLAR